MVRTALGTLAAILLIATSAGAQVAGDAIDMSQVTVYNSPQDVASWPITHAITALQLGSYGPNAGVTVTSDALNVWPDYVPPGWTGGLQYTVWAVVNVNGHWYTSGFIEMWRGRGATGAPIIAEFARNWAYDARWGPMAGHQPVAGEMMGFFITAGDARGVTTVTSLRERTNVVMVSLPANDTGSFTFSAFSTSATGVLGDADGDGKADLSVFRPSNGTWYARASSTNYATSAATSWGMQGDVPLMCDFDGDHRPDLTVFRPSTGQWFIRYSSLAYSATNYSVYQWGLTGDVPVCADFDGDGKSELTVFRPSNGTWYVLFSSSSYSGATAWYPQWGTLGDIPMVADYDGDGKTDLTVYRPSTGEWWVLYSSAGFAKFTRGQWGMPGDIPLAADFDGDGRTDLSVFRPSTGTWYIRYSSRGYDPGAPGVFNWGMPGDMPVVADFDGDRRADLTIFRPSTGEWFIRYSSSNYSTSGYYAWGAPGDSLMSR